MRMCSRKFECRLWPISLVNLNERQGEAVVVVVITIPTQLKKRILVSLLDIIPMEEVDEVV